MTKKQQKNVDERLTVGRLKKAIELLDLQGNLTTLQCGYWYCSALDCACPMGLWAMGERKMGNSPSNSGIQALAEQTFGGVYTDVFVHVFDDGRLPAADSEWYANNPRAQQAIEDAKLMRDAYVRNEFRREWEIERDANTKTDS